MTDLRPIPGFEGKADSDGRILADGMDIRRRHDDGRYYVYVDGRDMIASARLVCLAFHGDKPTDKDVCAHRNDVKDDDRPDNLYWATHAENMADARRNNCYRSGTFTDDQVRAILSMWPWYSIGSIANKFGVGDGAISAILNHRSYRWVERPAVYKASCYCDECIAWQNGAS